MNNMKPSKKKKNTYTIAFNGMIDMGLFAYCKQTPMPLITINGQKQETNTGWIKSKEFPNPYANEMAQRHIENTHKLGEKIATTIIEYLDKETNKPVVQLYPSAETYIFPQYKTTDYKKHLNHATRRDLQHEIEQRLIILNSIKAR
ncbi:MAG: hypothetical protein UIC65_00595 [Alphaproteobacteria bacterium]|nr:hypothetical protein [Alphaproteobacteria bacterium]